VPAGGVRLHAAAFALIKLEMLVLALQDVETKNRMGKAVINISWGVPQIAGYSQCLSMLRLPSPFSPPTRLC
jgi:hypothetical protein